MATFVTHDGVELAYEDRGGDGFPFVMLHGWGQTQAMFRHQLADLAPDRRVVTLDMRGHGRSAKPHHGYRIARFSRDVQEFARPPRPRPLRRPRVVHGRVDLVELHRPVRHGPDSPLHRRRPAFGGGRRAVDDRARSRPRAGRSSTSPPSSASAAASTGRTASRCATASCAACSAARRTRRSCRSCSPSSTRFRPTPACRCSSTTARRTGATSSPRIDVPTLVIGCEVLVSRGG